MAVCNLCSASSASPTIERLGPKSCSTAISAVAAKAIEKSPTSAGVRKKRATTMLLAKAIVKLSNLLALAQTMALRTDIVRLSPRGIRLAGLPSSHGDSGARRASVVRVAERASRDRRQATRLDYASGADATAAPSAHGPYRRQ